MRLQECKRQRSCICQLNRWNEMIISLSMWLHQWKHWRAYKSQPCLPNLSIKLHEHVGLQRLEHSVFFITVENGWRRVECVLVSVSAVRRWLSTLQLSLSWNAYKKKVKQELSRVMFALKELNTRLPSMEAINSAQTKCQQWNQLPKWKPGL